MYLAQNICYPGKEVQARLLIFSECLSSLSSGLFSIPIGFNIVDNSLKFVFHAASVTLFLVYPPTSVMIAFFFHGFLPSHHSLRIS